MKGRIILVGAFCVAAAIAVIAAAIPGSVPVSGMIAPTDDADEYATHAALYGKGGFRTVASEAERNAIPAARREAGMLVYVATDSSIWQLDNTLTNWVEFTVGGGTATSLSWTNLFDVPAGFADDIDDTTSVTLSWTNLLDIPAGFADNVDDTGGAGTGYLPLEAGVSNALTGDLHFKQPSDIRIPLFEDGTEKNAVGFRASGGVLSFVEYNTNDFTALEAFVSIDPTGETNVVRVLNEGYNTHFIVDAESIELNAPSVTFGSTNPISAAAITVTGTFNIGTNIIADANIASTIARDSEVSASYQPLDADLTTLAAKDGGSLTNLQWDAIDGMPAGFADGTDDGGAGMSWDISTTASVTNTTDAYSAVWSNAVPDGQTRTYSVDVLSAGATNTSFLRLFARVGNRAGTASAANWTSETNYTLESLHPSAYLTNVSTQAVLYARGPTNEPWNVFARGTIQVVTNGSTNATAPAATYIVNQGFEGTGYDNSESWVTVSGSPDPDYTGVALVDSQSLRINQSAAAIQVRAPEFSAESDVWFYFVFRPVTIDGSNRTVFELRDGTLIRAYVTLTSTGGIRINHGTSPATTTDTVTANTTIHVWGRYTQGSGSNGFAEIGWSTDGTKPTTGTKYASVSNGTSTTTVTRAYFGSSTTATHDWVFDKVRVDNENIGSNPE